MKTWLIMVFVFFFSAVTHSQSLSHLKLIAHYPFENDAGDVTGLQDSVFLVNAPFQDGGVFLNGIYVGNTNDPNASGAVTPQINGLSFELLAVSLDFKVTESYSSSRPVIVCGDSWRWMSVWLEADSTLTFKVNDIPDAKTSEKYSINTLHNVTMTYDSTKQMCKLYFDGAVVDSVNAVLDHHNDANFVSSDGGNATAFKGIWADLKIYSKDVTTGVQNEKLFPETVALLQNYPNPFNPETMIEYRLPNSAEVKIAIFNLAGQRVATLVDKRQAAGVYSVRWTGNDDSGQHVASGVYLYRLEAGGFVRSKKLVLLR